VTRTATLVTVKEALVETLGIEERADSITESTPLFGSMPEFDSLAIVELITVIEERFGFSMDDADITGDVFETVGSLAAYVDSQRS
jgi:acyl carrier protein